MTVNDVGVLNPHGKPVEGRHGGVEDCVKEQHIGRLQQENKQNRRNYMQA